MQMDWEKKNICHLILKGYSCVAMKNFFPTNYNFKQQNPNRAKITRPRAKSLRLDPTGRNQVRNVWLSHRGLTTTQNPAGQNQIHSQERFRKNSSERGVLRTHLVLLRCWASVHPKVKDRNRDRPQMLQAPILTQRALCVRSRLLRKREGLQEVRGVCGRGRLLRLQPNGWRQWLSGKESGWWGRQTGMLKGRKPQQGPWGAWGVGGGCN